MDILISETETATFSFEVAEATAILNRSEPRTEEGDDPLNFILSSSHNSINIPEKLDYFASITLDLISEGKGSVFCKLCSKTYQPDQLKPITVGQGKTPFSVNIKMKGGIKSLFRKNQSCQECLGERDMHVQKAIG